MLVLVLVLLLLLVAAVAVVVPVVGVDAVVAVVAVVVVVVVVVTPAVFSQSRSSQKMSDRWCFHLFWKPSKQNNTVNAHVLFAHHCTYIFFFSSSTHLAHGALFLKLRPPACAVLLVAVMRACLQCLLEETGLLHCSVAQGGSGGQMCGPEEHGLRRSR